MATQNIVIDVNGMSCSSCALRLEKALTDIAGADAARVNFATGKAYLTGPVGLEDKAIRAAQKEGFEASVALENSGKTPEKTGQTARQTALWAMALALPVFLMEMGGHVWPAFHHWQFATFGQSNIWALQCLLSAAVLFGPGWQFFKIGGPLLLRIQPNMDSLVALGSFAAWAYSTLVLIAPSAFPEAARNVYFEAAAVIVALILLGRWIEDRAKQSARSAMSTLFSGMPKSAVLLKAGQQTKVPVASLTVGDHILIKPGTRAPVDGEVIDGQSDVDTSAMTGEPLPVHVTPGDQIHAGSVNGAGVITIIVTQVGQNTVLAQVAQAVETAQSHKLPIQSAVDQVVRIFVPSVMAIAVLTFVAWILLGPDQDLSRAMIAAVSVLIIACPCAMGLATPMSIMVASTRASQLGVLFTNGAALERLANTKVFGFDKTGTLTMGTPVIAETYCIADMTSSKAIAIAAALESQSEHPLAQAFLAAHQDDPTPNVRNLKVHIGNGLSAEVDGHIAQLGSLKFAADLGLDLSPHASFVQSAEAKGQTLVCLAFNHQIAALFALQDQLRPTAAPMIAALHADGRQTALISGDRTPAVSHLAERLNIDTYNAEVTPLEKSSRLRALKTQHGSIAFIGDGINDAPALAEADVGIAIGEGTDLAIETADVVLMTPDLTRLTDALALSDATIRNIKQNLFWAFGYNSLLIPVAAGVFYPWFGWQLSPMLGAAAMAASSLFVVMNALRLRRFQAPSDGI
ncbi:heavy metal translocating P-type ATPase [Cognatishimia sp.]|uniref:heavy metal translocating P-type ATPase n=1 Tax=Cognatishimia sp. TaxID=2211648 RepID=UPI003BA85409